MNKKIIVIILFLFLILSVVMISLFGKQPKVDDPTVENIYFVNDKAEEISILEIETNNLEKNEEGFYVIIVQLNYVIEPENVVNDELEFKFVDSKTYEFASVSNTGLLTITLDELVPLSFTVTVHCLDKTAPFYQSYTSLRIQLLNENHDSGGLS